ncbi:Serine-threonine/tyrosine-protein kinase [Theobroma cacao]|nr:Serine-threonine/tyrosine-protein kinase [Theobroma cacao]
MDVKNLSFLFSCVILGINLSTAGLLKCYDTGNFTTNSTYGKNLDLFLSSLPANVSRNGGFYRTTIGQGSNVVHGLALCRGDTSSEACSNCVNLRVREIKASCPNQTEALLWEGDVVCLVRYANRSIFETLELEPSQAGYNTGNILSVTWNVTPFYHIWDNLMDGLVERASNGTSSLKFATGIANVELEKIYALMQCTPDISQKDCKACLNQTVDQYQRCCLGQRGGYVLTPNCHFRWDLYPFFDSSDDTLNLNPPPPHISPPLSATNNSTNRGDNGGLGSQAVVIIVVPIIILVAISALACILLRKRKNRKQENKSADNNNSLESLRFNFSAIKVSTDNFSENNKLGQGGFGTVYKGRLYDGQDIAVKRLSDNSVQGDLEFKNEVLLMAKLQHRNLVRLLGFSFEGKERLLIYEFLPNSSLDHFLFSMVTAWQSWKRGTEMNMIDPALKDGPRIEMMRCIHVGLLCVQAIGSNRPNMTSVVLMLSNYSMSLPLPSRPAFVDSTMEPLQLTVNEASVSELDPR